MKTAIIGLPMVGKTSLFTILTGVHESTRVGSMAARIGVAKVPDARLDALAKIFEPPKMTHATVEYLDFPAISKETLRDPSYLASLRVADAFAHVLRLFQSETVPHEKGSVDPVRDLEDVEIELILSDLVVVEKAHGAPRKRSQEDQEPGARSRVRAARTLQSGARTKRRAAHFGDDRRRRKADSRIPVSLAEAHAVRLEYRRRGRRPVARNRRRVSQRPAGRPHQHRRDRHLRKDRSGAGRAVAGRGREYLASYGLKDSALDRLISATYALLGLMSFLTAGETEVRAWTIPMHSPAQKAAGAIHSDFEKKFIRAEVVNWQALIDHGGYPGVREKGLLRLEGKEYIVKDGDVLVIRHG